MLNSQTGSVPGWMSISGCRGQAPLDRHRFCGGRYTAGYKARVDLTLIGWITADQINQSQIMNMTLFGKVIQRGHCVADHYGFESEGYCICQWYRKTPIRAQHCLYAQRKSYCIKKGLAVSSDFSSGQKMGFFHEIWTKSNGKIVVNQSLNPSNDHPSVCLTVRLYFHRSSFSVLNYTCVYQSLHLTSLSLSHSPLPTFLYRPLSEPTQCFLTTQSELQQQSG